MKRFLVVAMGIALNFWVWGCATPEVSRTPLPAVSQKMPNHYYVASPELNLKEAPDNSAKDKNVVRLNEKLEEIQMIGGWFQVSTADGRSGWASSKYLAIKPVTSLYISKNGLCLRAAPDEKSREVCKLRVNDLVKITDPQPQNWVEVSVERTKSKGWLEVKNLSKDPLVIAKRATKRRGQSRATKKRTGDAPEGNAVPAAPAAESPDPSAPESL